MKLTGLEREANGAPYRMTPAQRKQAIRLIRRECCNCEGGNCLVLDDGEPHSCPQVISYSVCCKWFRWAVLPLDKALTAEIYHEDSVERCALCGAAFVPRSNRAKYCPDCAGHMKKQRARERKRKQRENVTL